jgi:hypothetical protein
MKSDVWAALREGYTEPIRDALWGHIYLTPALAALTRSVPFMRLTRIFQLGPAYRVYPGATHTRAAHSIGVYHLARRLRLNLAERGGLSWLSAEGVRSFLCAGLLHDLGHFPYTHSLKELPLLPHEALTAALIRTEPMRSLVGAAGADPDLTAAMVDTGPEGAASEAALSAVEAASGGAGDQQLGFYRKLLSGCLDPDKLDYLNRDARYCGVPYGAQDVDFIYSRLYPQAERGLDMDSRLIPSVESILFSKYLMYRTVYWHPTVRSATAMIKKALLGGLRDKVILKDELYGLDDPGLFSLMADRAHPLFSLARDVREGPLYPSVAEFPFDPARHYPLTAIEDRYRHEEALAGELSAALGWKIPPAELIIDLPEPVNFETGLYVRDESRLYTGGSGVFTAEVVEGFIKSLRIIRIFAAPAHENRIKSYKGFPGILHNTQKWLLLV